jgi:hypothetical protein
MPELHSTLPTLQFLAHTAKFRSAVVNGGGDLGGQREQLERALDVLVGTPQRVMQHAGELTDVSPLFPHFETLGCH